MAKIYLDRQVGGRNTQIQELALDTLRLDPDNVRFRHLHLLPDQATVLSDEAMEGMIWDEAETKELLKTIVSAGGLMERPIVKPEPWARDDKRYVVKEGNRRIVALRKGRELLKEGKITELPSDAFDSVECEILPEETTRKEVAVYLSLVHVKGKKPWAVLNQADQIYRLHHEEGMTFDEIRERVGLSKGTVHKRYRAYEMALRFFKRYPKKADVKVFSYFDEALRKVEVRKWLEDPEHEPEFFGWVVSGKFNELGPVDVRHLPRIWQDPEARKAFDKGGIKEALGVLYAKDPSIGDPTFASVASAIKALKNIPLEQYKSIPSEPAKTNALRVLYKTVKEILSDLGIKA